MTKIYGITERDALQIDSRRNWRTGKSNRNISWCFRWLFTRSAREPGRTLLFLWRGCFSLETEGSNLSSPPMGPHGLFMEPTAGITVIEITSSQRFRSQLFRRFYRTWKKKTMESRQNWSTANATISRPIGISTTKYTLLAAGIASGISIMNQNLQNKQKSYTSKQKKVKRGYFWSWWLHQFAHLTFQLTNLVHNNDGVAEKLLAFMKREQRSSVK